MQCKKGDIILIDDYYHGGQPISKHSFVVLSNEGGTIKGLDYHFICNVLSSFDNEEQRNKKRGYPGNFEITHTDSSIIDGNTKDGFIKAEQIYYFNEDKVHYKVIGSLNPDVYNSLIEFIKELALSGNIEKIIDNLYD